MADYYFKIASYRHENEVYKFGLILTDQLKENSYNTHELTVYERERISTFRTRGRRNEYYAGRVAGKYLLMKYLGMCREEVQGISIRNNEDGVPYFSPEVGPVSCGISHSGNYLASLIFPTQLGLGIDLEDTLCIKDSIRYAVLPEEISIMPEDIDDTTFFTVVWVCKEALLKSIHGKIIYGMEKYQISEITKTEAGFLIRYRNYPEYTAICFKWRNAIVAIAGKGMENNVTGTSYLKGYKRIFM